MKLADLITEYRASHDFTSLRPKTRAIYEASMRLLGPIMSTRVDKISRRDILQIRDGFGSLPGKANIFVAVTSVLMRFAVEREIRDSNPTTGIRALKLGEWKRWPDEEIEKFLASPAPKMMKLAVLLAVYTGQRQGDILSLTWAQVEGNAISFRQQKTGQSLVIPMHPRLGRAMTQEYEPAVGKESDWILHTREGTRWLPNSFRVAFDRAKRQAGVIDYQFHGLRKSAAARLAEAGCSELEIMSVTGHKSLAMVSHYTKEASQVIRAGNAIRRLA